MGGLLALAFTAGMLAPVNPCGFALLPAWITHTLGDTTTDAFPVRMARALRAGTALTLGFAGTLAAAGLAVSAGARALIAAAPPPRPGRRRGAGGARAGHAHRPWPWPARWLM
ncbi:hypothetical protein [Gordonia sp. w5E2]|uniref:hypothetical protein n=1 Tax=Gordonia sp. w5E2 TaxID=3075837 RepID=UPI003FA60F4D